MGLGEKILIWIVVVVAAAVLLSVRDWVERNHHAETPRRLARNAAQDPVAGVRLANLLKLQREFPNRTLTRKANRRALEDGDPAVRLEAARFLEPQQGFRVLRELVVSDATLDAGIRADALRLLVERAPRKRVLAILDRILDDSPRVLRSWTIAGGRFHDEAQAELWRQAALASGLLGHAGASSRLISALDWQDPPSAAVAAEALGAIGDPAAEPALIKLLDSDDEAAALAAVRALGRIGTVAAVEPLGAQFDRTRRGVTLKGAAREAIEEIQGRLAGAECGQLGLADAAAGQGRLTVSGPSLDGSVSLSRPSRAEGEEREAESS